MVKRLKCLIALIFGYLLSANGENESNGDKTFDDISKE